MKTKSGKVMLLGLVWLSSLMYAQAPLSFKYQAIIRNPAGDVLMNRNVAIRTSLLQGASNGSAVYTETHQVSTNNAGMIVIDIGRGTSDQDFSAIDWSMSPYYLKVEADVNGGTNYVTIGTSELLSVPYALYSGGSSGWTTIPQGIYHPGNVGIGESNPESLLQVTAPSQQPMEQALFVVKNTVGDTVFAVYNEGVKITVPEGYKGGRGGFVVGGKTAGKGPEIDILRVSPDSVRVYVNDLASRKGGRGGFAIGGRAAKGDADNFLTLTPDNYYIGHLSGLKNTTGYYNTFFGYHAGQENTTGYENIFIGNESGSYNTDGFSNIFIGSYSGGSNSTGKSNVFTGTWAGYNNTTGYWNSFIGRQAGYYNDDGYSNIFIGDWSGHNNVSGIENVYIGDYAGGQNDVGHSNVFVGAEAGTYSSGVKNIYIGAYAGQYAGSDSNNIFIGTNSGWGNESGVDNIFLGNNTGYGNTTGSENVFLGTQAGESNTEGSNNIFMGNNAGYSNTTGYHNIFLGNKSGWSNEDGMYNVLIGTSSGTNVTSGYSNNFMGDESGVNTTIGFNNTFIGDWTGKGNVGGNKNTYIGAQAGYSSTAGNGNVFLGYAAGFYETGSNKLYIENSTADKTTALIYGEFDNNYLRFNGRLAVNHDVYTDVGLTVAANPTDNYAIYALGTCYSTVGWYYPSDIRWKKNIQDLNFSLTDLMALKPVSYNWKTEEYPDMKFSSDQDIGIIAQELEKVLPSLVKTDPRGFKSVDYSKLSVVLLKAVQEQQVTIESQQNQINSLLERVKALESKK